MALNRSTPLPQICSVRRWIDLILRYVTPRHSSCLLTVRIHRTALRSPEIARAEYALVMMVLDGGTVGAAVLVVMELDGDSGSGNGGGLWVLVGESLGCGVWVIE
ncbi:hypothetical protein GQ457_15G016730 [Hibiscus cannabinus]